MSMVPSGNNNMLAALSALSAKVTPNDISSGYVRAVWRNDNPKGLFVWRDNGEDTPPNTEITTLSVADSNGVTYKEGFHVDPATIFCLGYRTWWYDANDASGQMYAEWPSEWQKEQKKASQEGRRMEAYKPRPSAQMLLFIEGWQEWHQQYGPIHLSVRGGNANAFQGKAYGGYEDGIFTHVVPNTPYVGPNGTTYNLGYYQWVTLSGKDGMPLPGQQYYNKIVYVPQIIEIHGLPALDNDWAAVYLLKHKEDLAAWVTETPEKVVQVSALDEEDNQVIIDGEEVNV